MAKNRESHERYCKNPKCRVRVYDAGAGEKPKYGCPNCGSACKDIPLRRKGDSIKITLPRISGAIIDTANIIEKIKCSGCASDNLDIYIVENSGMEETQIYVCRKCKNAQYFGVSE